MKFQKLENSYIIKFIFKGINAMTDDPGILCYQHSKSEPKVFSFSFCDICKFCNADLSKSELRIPPFRIPYPFKTAAREPNAVVIKPTNGDFLNNYVNSTNLHIGITDSNGYVYEYDYNGINKTTGDDWSQCFPVKILNSSSLQPYWDQVLNECLEQNCWSSKRYSAEHHNCYTFVLTFLRTLELQELYPYLTSKTTFCEHFVAPQARIAAKYIGLYRQLKNEGIFVQ